jgi:hypothetical protein
MVVASRDEFQYHRHNSCAPLTVKIHLPLDACAWFVKMQQAQVDPSYFPVRDPGLLLDSAIQQLAKK